MSAVLVILSYELGDAERTFDQLRLPLYTLTNFEQLFAAATERGELTSETIESISTWRRNPWAWSERHGGVT